jgi:hypothetical protein
MERYCGYGGFERSLPCTLQSYVWADVICVESLDLLSEYCRYAQAYFPLPLSDPTLSEFLIHAADVEGLCQGIDEELVRSKPVS